MSNLTLPTIHLNGSGRKSLDEQCCEVVDALRKAIDLLREHYPNGRDYYPQGPNVVYQAGREQDARIAKVREVLAEIEAIHEHVADAK